jgi:hypothetical protein
VVRVLRRDPGIPRSGRAGRRHAHPHAEPDADAEPHAEPHADEEADADTDQDQASQPPADQAHSVADHVFQFPTAVEQPIQPEPKHEFDLASGIVVRFIAGFVVVERGLGNGLRLQLVRLQAEQHRQVA